MKTLFNEAGLYLHTSFTQVRLKVDGLLSKFPQSWFPCMVASGIHFNLEDARHFECGRGGTVGHVRNLIWFGERLALLPWFLHGEETGSVFVMNALSFWRNQNLTQNSETGRIPLISLNTCHIWSIIHKNEQLGQVASIHFDLIFVATANLSSNMCDYFLWCIYPESFCVNAIISFKSINWSHTLRSK